ncbi:plectin-like [Toxotes jaculatrix]|uniref:plectin-like n=1 Tax=Toxotes jaculatrix TaxID=941984 RepID=UPI001B3AA285|nr:plectin-like [Toxotes jaculatrix]
MEDHMASSETTGTGSSSVTMVTDSMGTDPDLRVLCKRVNVLKQKAGSTIQTDSYLRNRIRELERSERSLLLQLYQLASASHLPSMQHSQRLDQRLHMLREEVRTMTQEKVRGEQVWRERLQRCQRQLKAKEEEMSRQSQYFENFKTQLQHKLSLARDREQSLQNRIYTLEKQLLDMTVSAATGMATVGAVRITAGTVTHWAEQERLTSMRGEGEGEEEKKEERRKQWQPNVGTEREGGREGDEGKTEKETEGGRNKDTKQNTDDSRLQGFILSLQEDLRVLLEREEDAMMARRGLMEQLQEAQESSHFLGCKVEEMKAEVHQLKRSESSLMEEVEELREENHKLQQSLREAANQTPSQSSTVPEFTFPSPGTSSPSCSPAVCPGPSNAQSGSSGEVRPTLNGATDLPSAVVHVHHQDPAESAQNNTEDLSSSAKSGPLSLFSRRGSKHNLSFQSLSLTTETIDEFKLGTWCSRGLLNLEEIPSEESDALREAYRSLRLGEDLEALQEQRGRLEAALQHTQEELEVVARENTQLKLQLRNQVEELEAAQGSSREKFGTGSTCDGADHLQSSPTQDNTIVARDDLVQALNQENRALADRIQELLAHIELREEDIKIGQTQLREHVSKLEEDRARLEQENQEQGCLITELTRKTEDDLNTIMELQQKLEESGEGNNLEECVDSLVESVLKGEEKPQLKSSQQPGDLNIASEPGSQHSDHHDSSQNSPQNTLQVSSLTDQVYHLSKTVQSLKTEQDDLTGNIHSLREQQGEVALSVKTQTEEKQQLTRAVWGLKEEKDCISQCLAGLKQEREQLTRTVCGLKDERDHFIRSMSGLKEEKEQLTKSLSGLEREKEALTQSLSRGKGERDQIMPSLQSLQTESDQLSQAVLNLKHERDELNISLKCLKEQRDREQSSYTLQGDGDKLIKSVSTLRGEKEKIEHSITCLKQEEKQIMLIIQGLREETNNIQSALPSQIQTGDKNQRQHLLNPNSAGNTKETETLVGTGDYSAQRCQTYNYKENSIQQEQTDLMTEIEALGAQLKRSREELDKSHEETKKLHSELCQSDARRQEAERKAAQAAEKVMRLTDVTSEMEETRRENESLNTQVKELQSKLTGLVREKTDALSLKTQTEEQYNILTAQLKAKTVALQELNSEYISLKRGQGCKDDLSTVLMSLRTRYNDIRAKYDALLKKKSQTDLDLAPLKAKLSCLVVKCQERNNFLVQMMKTMHRQGCLDSTLKQQVEQLLSDAALQDYTAAFTPGSIVKTGDYSAGFAPRFISKFQDYTSGFIPDQTCPAAFTPANEQHRNGFMAESGVKCRDSNSEKHVPISTAESSANLRDCSSVVTPVATETQKKNANSPVPTALVQESASVEATPESVITNEAQLSPSATGPIQAASGPEKFGVHHPDMRAKSSTDLTSSRGSSPSRAPPSFSTHVSPSRRLSSPEKIISLHEQLQKTLMSSFQAPGNRGRGQEPRKSLSFSAPGDLNPASQTNKQSLSFNKPHCSSLPVTAASSQAKDTPVVTTEPAATNKPATLFNAVASRSANVALSPNIFTYHHFKADKSKTTTSACSRSSTNSLFAAMAPDKAKSTSNSGTEITTSPKLSQKVTAIPNVPDATHRASTPVTLRTTTFDSDVLISSDTNPKTTASDMTAPGQSTAPKFNISYGAAPACDGLPFAASGTQSARCSPERSITSIRKSTAAPDKTKAARPRPAAPAEVRSVEVIKTVGQSSLMIGWERPPLDELGCSNGTFVYGYRVFIDGDFHKSVMSSACTKCVVENVDLSVPVHISVQTLGSNGLISNSVHTTYRTSVRTDQH